MRGEPVNRCAGVVMQPGGWFLSVNDSEGQASGARAPNAGKRECAKATRCSGGRDHGILEVADSHQ